MAFLQDDVPQFGAGGAQYLHEQEAELAGIIDGVREEIDKAIAEKVTPRFNKIDEVLEEIIKRLPPAPPSPKP